MRRGGPIALLCATALLSCRLAGTSADVDSALSIEQERRVTEDIARQIRARAPLVNDAVLLAYLDEIGQSIVGAIGPQPFLYRFSIIDDDTLNAFTIGGGHVYIHSGVLMQVGDVSELAGVLAHEIAHVRERHVVERQEGQALATLLTVAAAAAVAMAGADPELLMLAQSINVALELRNSRAAETEADYEGIQLMVSAGYAPRGMTRFFERILLESPRGSRDVPSYLFTHPAVDERIAATRGQIARLETPAGLRIRDDRLAAMQARLTTLQSGVAGGSGLLARTQYDPTHAEPALAQAEELRAAGRLAEADAVLAEAERQEPADPRIPLARGGIAEAQGDLPRTLDHMRSAFALAPDVPLTLYEVGRAHALLGERGRALFYLDRASVSARPGSRLRGAAEREIDLAVFPPFERIALLGVEPRTETAPPGSELTCEIELHARAIELGLPVRLWWRDASGAAVLAQELRPGSDRRAVARYTLPDSAGPGAWSVEIRIGDGQRHVVPFDVAAD